MTTNIIPTNTILHGDCIEEMRRLPDACIPLTLTSPPYAKMRTYGGHGYGREQFQQIATELARITMSGGVICWVVRNQIIKGRENCQAEREKLFFVDELGLWAQQTLIGVPKGCPLTKPANNRYSCNFDYIYIFSKGKPRHVHVLRDKLNKDFGKVKRNRMIREANGTERRACGGEYLIPKWGHRTNVWGYVTGGHTSTDAVSRKHPARMPEKLAEDLILSFSKPNDLVFDPMAGAGTTLKMAMLNNRKWLGVEIFADYVDLIRHRMEQAKSEHRMRTEKALRRIAG